MPGNDHIAKHTDTAVATHKAMITADEARSQFVDLRLQAHRLEVALNNITQGVCFFDGGRNLVLANRSYAEIYRLPMECIRPGSSLAEIVERRAAVGTIPHMTVKEYLDWRREIQFEGLPSNTAVKLRDGRTIAIHRRPMPDGGWVSTHEDITDQPNRKVTRARGLVDEIVGSPYRPELR
jgi:PAS domain-containing protein